MSEEDLRSISGNDKYSIMCYQKFIWKYSVFNIESNQIPEIPDELSTWTSLKGLNAANNLLTAFAEPIYSLENLLILDLSGNQIVGRSFIKLDWQFMLIFSKDHMIRQKLRIFSILDMRLRLLFLASKHFMLSEIDVDRLYGNCSKLAKLNLSKNPLSDEVRQKLESSPKKPENLRLTLWIRFIYWLCVS